MAGDGINVSVKSQRKNVSKIQHSMLILIIVGNIEQDIVVTILVI